MNINLDTIKQSQFAGATGTYGNTSNHTFDNLTLLNVKANAIEESSFKYTGNNIAKTKVKCPSIGNGAFESAGGKFWICKECLSIGTTGLFGMYSNATCSVYCEASSKPSAWPSSWNNTGYNTLTVYWGVSEASFDAL